MLSVQDVDGVVDRGGEDPTDADAFVDVESCRSGVSVIKLFYASLMKLVSQVYYLRGISGAYPKRSEDLKTAPVE